MSRPAVFLDKDGTVVEDVPYNVDPALVRPRPDAAHAVRRLRHAGYAVVLVTNQSGLARGLFDQGRLAAAVADLRRKLAAGGGDVDAVFVCPHHPEGTVPRWRRECGCRKPAPGLLYAAARRLDLDLTASWMVGDILDDVEAGHRAGCRAVLVDVGSETVWRLDHPSRHPDAIVPTLAAAAATIVASRVDAGSRR